MRENRIKKEIDENEKNPEKLQLAKAKINKIWKILKRGTKKLILN